VYSYRHASAVELENSHPELLTISLLTVAVVAVVICCFLYLHFSKKRDDA
jgi:hypothetical protein